MIPRATGILFTISLLLNTTLAHGADKPVLEFSQAPATRQMTGQVVVKDDVIRCFPDGKDGVVAHHQIVGKSLWVDAIRRDGKTRQVRVTSYVGSAGTKTPVKIFWPPMADGTVTWNIPVTRDGDVVSASVPWNGVLIGDLMDVNEGAAESAAAHRLLGVTSGANPGLPVMFASGDSICLSYWPYLEAELNNEANIYYQQEVAKDMPAAGLGACHHAHLAHAFLETAYKDARFKPEYLLMNFGLHMIATHQKKVAEYGQWIERIDDLAKQHRAQLIWVMTTPYQQSFRPAQNLVVIQFNDAARKIAEARHIPIVDLHAATLAINNELGDKQTYTDGVHFTDEARKRQAAHIANRVRDILKKSDAFKPR